MINMPCYLSVLLVFLFFSVATIETVRESLNKLISAVGPKNLAQLYLKAKARSEFKYCFFSRRTLNRIIFWLLLFSYVDANFDMGI